MKGPKNGVLKASIKDTPIEDRKLFHKSSCMLLISVGQPYHEGEKLSAAIDLVNSKFKSCTLMVCDTLQRYNMLEFCNDENAYELSLKKGEEWLKRNNTILSKLVIPYNIIRWNDILNHRDYEAKLKKVEVLYQTDFRYKLSFTKTTDNYVLRVTRRSETLDEEKKYQNSLNYLKEECAGMLIWADQGYSFEVYPTKRAEVLEATYELLIKPFYPEILMPASIRFKRYSRSTQINENSRVIAYSAV